MSISAKSARDVLNSYLERTKNSESGRRVLTVEEMADLFQVLDRLESTVKELTNQAREIEQRTGDEGI